MVVVMYRTINRILSLVERSEMIHEYYVLNQELVNHTNFISNRISISFNALIFQFHGINI